MTTIARTRRGGLEASVFLVGSASMLFATRVVIPILTASGWEPLLAWFAAAAGFVFAPLLVTAGLLLRAEGVTRHAERLRFRRMTRRDWALTATGALAITVGSGAGAGVVLALDQPLHPPFLQFEPLGPDRLWLLAVWLPFWVLNVMGEEICWRGVLLPRQQQAHGEAAWLVQAGLWVGFHLTFGLYPMLTMLPILVVIPWVAQRTGNTWPAVILHALANGPAFVLIALGVL